jgi:RNA recognition motif-containing protein
MPPVKLFVGGLSFTTTNDSLRDAFARFGNVTSAIVMTDRETGRSRGFGFVEMGSEEEAERAIGGLNGKSVDNRMIRVDKATPRGSAPPGGRRPPGGPPTGRFAPGSRGPGGGPGSRGPGGPGGGGFGARTFPPPAFDPRPGFGDKGSGRGPGRGDRRRPGESEARRPKRSGKPLPERRSEDKGRRGEDRW